MNLKNIYKNLDFQLLKIEDNELILKLLSIRNEDNVRNFMFNNKIIDNYKRENSEIIILTTEKDAQKMQEFQELSKFPIYYLKVSIDFIRNKDKFEEKIIKYVRAHS